MTTLMCLAFAVYFEARSEMVTAQYAVAEVVVNRVEDDRFPDTVCGVIKEDRGPQPWDCQFSFYCDGKPELITEPLAMQTAKAIAADVLDGNTDFAKGALWYHTDDIRPDWSSRLKRVAKRGAHLFFGDAVS